MEFKKEFLQRNIKQETENETYGAAEAFTGSNSFLKVKFEEAIYINPETENQIDNCTAEDINYTSISNHSNQLIECKSTSIANIAQENLLDSSEQICRLCTQSITNTKVYLYDDSGLEQKINYALPITAGLGDGLPEYICQNCDINLNLMYDFVCRVVDADKSLRRSNVLDVKTNDDASSPVTSARLPEVIQVNDSNDQVLNESTSGQFCDDLRPEDDIILNVHNGRNSIKRLLENEDCEYNISQKFCSLDKESEESDSLPPEIEEAANKASLDLVPAKSRQQYNIAYSRFIEWCKRKNVEGNYSENVLLGYFEEKSKLLKSSTLWTNYSMIKKSLIVKNKQDISKYYKLLAFLKWKAKGYRPKKSKILTREQFDSFLTQAPDEKYLMLKVATIMGLFGACRREELCQMTVDDIEDVESSLVVKISDIKTKALRTFSIVGTYMNFYRKYIALRPPNIGHGRLFIKYMCNKCTTQPVGKNTIGKMPADIAKFLKLPDSSSYTGRCFRRSSESLLADSGANLTIIKVESLYNG